MNDANLPDFVVEQIPFRVAVKINPVTYGVEAMRAIVLDGSDWPTTLTGV